MCVGRMNKEINLLIFTKYEIGLFYFYKFAAFLYKIQLFVGKISDLNKNFKKWSIFLNRKNIFKVDNKCLKE